MTAPIEIYSAPSALIISNNNSTWAVGPGFCISRLRRLLERC